MMAGSKMTTAMQFSASFYANRKGVVTP
uniref:Uncharacterized protein n=1 Tax=Anguilla anguilla TaxID=7936 RepID=A0A0E9SB13_ANGAN